jgi:LAO/AO transport system kinase
MTRSLAELANNLLAGDKKSLAQLISMVEDERLSLAELRDLLPPRQGKAYRIGITGPPGAGKSTLVDKLTSRIRERDLSVGIIAVDPSSPLSGGAVLGDRVRMQRHYLDEGVFIRSMASRGSHGGLSRAVEAVVSLLDAFGRDIIIIETVGVGQTEFEIARIADTVVLVLVPESGDDVQALKAGITEVADIIVVNKADREGAERLVEEFRATLTCRPGGKEASVVTAQAVNDIGIEELYQEIDKRRKSC